MADNKQYITQELDKGNVFISENVISTIVFQSVKDVEGVMGLSAKPGAEIIEKLSRKNWGKGIKVTFSEDNTISISCNVVVSYGQNVVTVAKAVQNAISAAIDSISGIQVTSVNVNISEIVRQ